MGPLLGEHHRGFRPEVDRYYVTDTPVTGPARQHAARTSGASSTAPRTCRSCTSPCCAASASATRRPSSRRSRSTARSRWACSTRCRSRAATRCSRAAGSRTSATSTDATSSSPRPARPRAASIRCCSPPGRSRRRRSSRRSAFGSQHTFFATNGTSSANKIVVQALVEPGDVVLIDRDCHKSHHYGMVLSGAYPVYLHSYPLPKYSMYGAVPLEHIREKLLTLKRGRPARQGEDAAAHQLHLRRRGLQRGAGDGAGAGPQARHGLPVGRGLVRLRRLQPPDAAADGDARGREAAREVPHARRTEPSTQAHIAALAARRGRRACPTPTRCASACTPRRARTRR